MAIDEGAFLIEMVVDVGVDRRELLQRLHLSNQSIAGSRRGKAEMAIFGLDVGPAADLLLVSTFGLTEPLAMIQLCAKL